MSLVVKINNMNNPFSLSQPIPEGYEAVNANTCNHIMVDIGKYERECRFCGLTELRAK